VTAYVPRVADEEIAARLAYSGAVLIEGPRACGKTATALRLSASQLLLDSGADLRQVAELDPKTVLAGPRPRLVDEWQLVPSLWNAARHIVDREQRDGLFIFTGSSVPADDATRHSGAGRFSRYRMRPMTLYESGASVADVSMARLLAGESSSGQDSGRELSDVIEAVARGGFPANRARPLVQAVQRMRDYVRAVELTDIRVADGVRRDPSRVSAVLKSLARNVATEATITTISIRK